VFIEPFGCDGMKEHIIYMRWETGGITGGSCWGTKHHHREGQAKPRFKVLDLVLKEIKPNLTFLEYREIEDLINSDSGRDHSDYYGNYYEYGFEYIPLAKLYEKLESLD
jgi:hypothetical protein